MNEIISFDIPLEIKELANLNNIVEVNPYKGHSSNLYQVFQQWAIDFVGPFPTSKSGSKFILVCMDTFSRFPLAVPTKRADAITAATFLYENVFCVFGPVTSILSDNGAHFANQVVNNLVKLVKTKHQLTTPYNPAANGMVEKYNGTLCKSLKKLAAHKPGEWDTYIPTVLYSYRVRAHEVLDISPYELVYGVAPLTADLDPIVNFGRALGFERLLKMPSIRAASKHKDMMVRSPPQVVTTLPAGTWVLRRRFAKKDKMTSNWEEIPYVVLVAFGNNTYLLMNSKTGKISKKKTNGVHLRVYCR